MEEQPETATAQVKKPVASARKLVTQGQADNLTLKELNEHTTLTFEINRKKKKKKKGGKAPEETSRLNNQIHAHFSHETIRMKV